MRTTRDGIEVPPNAAWRRIDDEWLYSAESLALKLNTGINNTSLVLAFELPASKKVLFFAGDAQRGNWVSWADLKWTDGDETITARDLLRARCSTRSATTAATTPRSPARPTTSTRTSPGWGTARSPASSRR